ncbi:MAG TPA: hypothetical protein VH120_03420 [Gemmataceae bacterium]|jgi:hypothetical protein|nr:hypothetical protein [Gemmataceae bacterium]
MDVPPKTPLEAGDAGSKKAELDHLASAYEQYWHWVDNDDPAADTSPSCATLAGAYDQFWQSADA